MTKPDLWPESGWVKPSNLSGFRNGELPDSVLASVPFPFRGRLNTIAARAFVALADAYRKATGVRLGTTSAADSYRSRANQIGAFMKRYQKVYNPTTCTLEDGRLGPDGKRWYKHRGVAALAGFDSHGNVRSLHGWGLANDCKAETGRLNVDWLDNNARRFGIHRSSTKEPWHWFYTAGDSIPPAVLSFEEQHKPTPPNPNTKPTVRLGSTGPDVIEVQKAVGATPDGQFGPVTQRRVIKFQQEHGLVADGIVGPQTWKLII